METSTMIRKIGLHCKIEITSNPDNGWKCSIYPYNKIKEGFISAAFEHDNFDYLIQLAFVYLFSDK